VAFTLCVLLWSVPGQEALLVDYEDQVLALLAAHGATVLQRVRAIELTETPFEVQTLRFPSQAAFDAFMADPARVALASMRDQSVARTELFRVEVVDPPT
jgi:uncharacterized protein (DUF1330 family)